MLTACLIFGLTCLAIALNDVRWLRISRSGAALLGATAMVVFGALPAHRALRSIDFRVLATLLGMMILGSYLEKGGFFEWTASKLIKRARTAPVMMTSIYLAGALLSAFFVNDSIALVLAPMIVVVAREGGVRPAPYLIALAIGSNIGSLLVPAGSAQNILATVHGHIPFASFMLEMAPAALGSLVIGWLVLRFVFRKELALPISSRPPLRVQVELRATTPAIICFLCAFAAWIMGASMPVVALAAGSGALALGGRDVEALKRVDWTILVFFAAIFVGVAGLEYNGFLISWVEVANHFGMGASVDRTAAVVGISTAVMSLIGSNIPGVLIWSSVVPDLPSPEHLWRVLAASATLAGNLTLFGCVTNILILQSAKMRGASFSFREHLKVGLPVGILSIAWALWTFSW